MEESDDFWLVKANAFGPFLIFGSPDSACDMFDCDDRWKACEVDRIIIILESIGLGLYDVPAILPILCVADLSAQFPLNLAELAENIILLHLPVPLQLLRAIEQAFIVGLPAALSFL